MTKCCCGEQENYVVRIFIPPLTEGANSTLLFKDFNAVVVLFIIMQIILMYVLRWELKVPIPQCKYRLSYHLINP